MKITNELLAAYAEGNVTESERQATRLYLAEHPDKLEDVLFLMDKDFDIQLENRDRDASYSFTDELDAFLAEVKAEEIDMSVPPDGILQLMPKAAQNVADNLCAVRCEGYALRALGIDASDQELETEAENQGVLKLDGTELYRIGQLSAQKGLYVSRKHDCTIDDVMKALKHGDIVIAVKEETQHRPHDDMRNDMLYGKRLNHAVIVKAIDAEKNRITLLDPGEITEMRDFPLDVYMEVWNKLVNYLIISNRSHYKPHPINLSNIKLEKAIKDQREVFAENVHEVWAKNKKEEGWVYGPIRDDFKKTDPYLLPYDLLPEKEKEFFRLMSMESIKFLKKLGWKFVNSKRRNKK